MPHGRYGAVMNSGSGDYERAPPTIQENVHPRKISDFVFRNSLKD